MTYVQVHEIVTYNVIREEWHCVIDMEYLYDSLNWQLSKYSQASFIIFRNNSLNNTYHWELSLPSYYRTTIAKPLQTRCLRSRISMRDGPRPLAAKLVTSKLTGTLLLPQLPSRRRMVATVEARRSNAVPPSTFPWSPRNEVSSFYFMTIARAGRLVVFHTNPEQVPISPLNKHPR